MEPEEKIEAAVDTKTVTNKNTKQQKITQSATVEGLAHIRYESHSAADGQEMLIIAADRGKIKPILQVQPGCGSL